MTLKKQNKINEYIKNKIINEKAQHSKYINSEKGRNLFFLFNFEEELWASIFISDILEKSIKTEIPKVFFPFFLIPIKLNTELKKEQEDIEKFIKLMKIKIEVDFYKDYIYFENNISNPMFSDDTNLILLDDTRKTELIFNNQDKKELLSFLRKIKQLDVFNIFDIKTLLMFIEEEIKNSIFMNKSNFIYTNYTKKEDFVDLKLNNVQSIFLLKNKMSFALQQDNKNIILTP